MSSTTYKSSYRDSEINDEIIIKVTKTQLVNFSLIIMVLFFLIIDYLAITSNSPLLTELTISQGVIAIIALIKFSKSNKVRTH
ncbi:MAG: hypothetical protein HWD82_04385 [Flavobacteriaceae bacterium]|nr:hypothetical protein [Flavobacteriaceae bacterium]